VWWVKGACPWPRVVCEAMRGDRWLVMAILERSGGSWGRVLRVGALIGSGHSRHRGCNTATSHGLHDLSATLARLYDTLMKIGCH
jgi:hypothetical protein